ncbi:MAG: TAXI family TRAP transporter solute-binding subunit [Lawsonibacter sp.]|nr:TAXI family TRAP transporter solute-binding subunit [Lawsonibacter sp.]
MRKNGRWYAVGVLFCALVMVSVGILALNGFFRPPADGTANIQVLTIGTADSGGTMYPVGRAIAEALNQYVPTLKLNIGASGGSLANVEALRNGQIDLGLVSGDVAYCAYHGTEEFSGKPLSGLRAIAAVYLSESNWLVQDSLSGVTYVHDLLGKRVAVGPESSTTELSARTALQVVGIDSTNTTLANYGLGSGCTAVEAGELDAVHGMAGIPISAMQKLAATEPCRLLLYTDEELDEILTENDQYVRVTIPAWTYAGQAEDVSSFGVKCLLCVSQDMDEGLVYTLTKTLYQSIPELAERHSAVAEMAQDGFACNDLPIPLHSGAQRYYEEIGLLAAESPS